VECKRIFFDTNIVLDIIDKNRAQYNLANKLLNKVVLDGYDILITQDMLSTIFYIHKDKTTTLKFFKIIQEDWLIEPFSKKLIEEAIDISLEKNLDLEDVLQCLCAKKNGCDLLITNDKNFYDCGITVMSSQEFLEKN
jgi:predicted nucleic acid-binding protein